MASRNSGWSYIVINLVALSCGGEINSDAAPASGIGTGGPLAMGGQVATSGQVAVGGQVAIGGQVTMGGQIAMGGTFVVPPLTNYCGDGHLDLTEECDDFNHRSGDGCSPQCWVELGYVCPEEGTHCYFGQCGNGVLDAYEICDDGNTLGGDGCFGDCSDLEPGWACPGAGLRCTPICGDGVVTGQEGCDDGNRDAYDGCSAHCSIEVAGPCSAARSDCNGTTMCGNGILDDDEECDDGTGNRDDAYGGCTSLCRLGPRCGDSVVNGPESCDLTQFSALTSIAYGVPGCTKGCQLTHYCGDGFLDNAFGEWCDLGPGPIPLSSGCTPDCEIFLGP